MISYYNFKVFNDIKYSVNIHNYEQTTFFTNILIPYSYFNIVSGSNTFTLSGETLTITPGFYENGTKLASVLQTALNTNTSGLTFTVSYSLNSHKLTISETGVTPYNISLSEKLRNTFGISNSTGITSSIGPHIVNIDPGERFLINLYLSGKAVKRNYYDNYTGDSYSMMIYKDNSEFGDHYNYPISNILNNEFEINEKNITSVKIQIYNEYGELIDFNGQHIYIGIRN
jgi:hypothetical protein